MESQPEVLISTTPLGKFGSLLKRMTYRHSRTYGLLLSKQTLQVNSSKEEEWLNIQESSGQNPLGIL